MNQNIVPEDHRIMKDTSKSIVKPPVPSVRDTIKLLNTACKKISSPAVNKTVLLNSHCDQNSNKIIQQNKSIEEEKSHKNTKGYETKLFIDKKKKERTEKKKLELLNKVKLAEERKKKLAELQKTTKALAKASIKKKTINHDNQNEWKISLNVSTESNRPEVDLTRSPLSKVNSFNKTMKTPFDEQKKPFKELEKMHYDDSYFNTFLNLKNDKKIHLPVECVDENCCNIEKHDDENFILKKRHISDVNLSKKSLEIINIDTGTNTDIQLLNQSYKQIMNSSDHLVENQELVSNQCLPIKTCHSESTQTDGCGDLLSFFSPKIHPPPLNFISVLKCKNNLQKKASIDLEFSKQESDFKTNDNNLNKCMDNMKSVYSSNILKINDCDSSLNLQNTNHTAKEDLLIKNEFELNTETIKSKSSFPSLIKYTENNVCVEKSNLNNDKLFPEFNKITNEDIKQALKKLNYHFDSLTENPNNFKDSNMHLKNITNNSIDLSSPFHEIHDEFQAELSTLDQLNDSLHDIEKMSGTMSTKTDNSVYDEPNNHSISNNFSSQIILNTAYSNKYKPTSVSKLNALSTNMMTVDKTITGFSIQMFEQLIKDEELRAKQHHTILNLREKTLINRLKWEVAMCELQMKSIKNQSDHEKHLQTFKQKQRGCVKKLEHSLSQVKRLGSVIDSVYKKRLIMLYEHLQYLRTQSSSKNVIRKLKSLDKISKKDDYTCGSVNSKFFKQCDKTDFIDTNLNPYEFHTTSKNNSLQSVNDVNKSNILLQDQATSPIRTETRCLKKVEVIQTDYERSLQSTISKYTQTSKSLCNYENKLTEEKKPIDNRTQLVMLPTSSTKTKQFISETSNSTNSEQSDLELRITTLQEQLEARKMESFKLKKEQKKLRLENLKAKEQDLLKQIELYDKKIEESKKSLMVDIEKKSIQIKCDSPLKNSNNSIIQNMIKYDIDHTIDKSQNLPVSDRILLIGGKTNVHPIEMKKSTNHNNTSLEKSMNAKNTVIESNAKFNKYTDNCDFEDTDLVTKVCEVVLLPKEISAREVKTLKESDEINKTEINNVLLKSQQSNVVVENLTDEIQSNKLNTIANTKVNPLCNNSIQNLKTPIISSNQELHLEKNTNMEKLPISYSNINNNHSITSSTSSSDIERKFTVDFNETDYECEKNGNDINPLKVSNNDIEVDKDYSLDFPSIDKTSECQKSYENIIDLQDVEQNNESSSYEEERSEGDIMFEDKTFIEPFSDDGYLVHDEIASSDKVDIITNNIFNNLLKDSNITLKSNMGKKLVHSGIGDLNNLTEDTPLLMILKREEELQHIVFLSEQARTISNVLLNRNLHQILSEILPVYLPRLNALQLEKLKLYLNWSSSKRKKLKLPKCLSLQHKINDVENAESFELYYQKFQDQKKSTTIQDERSDVMLSQTQQEAEKLKLEQLRIEEEIERLRMTEKTQFVQRNLPIKPPPPYKSPTKKKSLAYIPISSDEIYKIVLTAASQLFNNDSQLSMLNEYVVDSDSNLHTDYKTLIFDYCKEVVQETLGDENNVPIWKKNSIRLKNFRSKPENPKDLTDTVVKKINQIIDIDECEEKVNKFVVKQMHEEDSKWFDFQMDEFNIQNDIVESLIQKLICDTLTDIKKSFYLKFIR